MNKRDLRAEIARAVAALPPDYCRRADEAICRAVLASAEYRRAGTLFCYVGTDREIDTRPILTAALRDGKTLAVPLCVGRGIMEARRIGGLEELVPGKYGIPAPRPGCPLVEPGEIDLALIPCCTGNRRGQRLGYGGGFYDRYLARTRCTAMLLCRERLVREDIPTEPHDRTMDMVVTEAGITPVGPAGQTKEDG